MKSTPAPWSIHGFSIYGGAGGNTLVASVPCADWSDDPYERKHAAGHEEAGFNSALIARAPAMLAILRELEEWVNDPDAYTGDAAEIAESARALLAEIEGEV